jgi:hypothetical protein
LVKKGSSEALMELFKAGADPNKHEKDGLTGIFLIIVFLFLKLFTFF